MRLGECSKSRQQPMKCLFCENPVPLVQSLVKRGVPFCCDGHRKAYHVETQRLMLARLMETLTRYGQARTEEVEPVYETVNSPHQDRRPEMLRRLITS